MKKSFIAKGQTRFTINTISFAKYGCTFRDGKDAKYYTKAFALPVGQRLVVQNTCKQTDEGYEAVHEVRENCGGTLFREITTHSQDCDGKYSNNVDQKLVNGAWQSVITARKRWVTNSI